MEKVKDFINETIADLKYLFKERKMRNQTSARNLIMLVCWIIGLFVIIMFLCSDGKPKVDTEDFTKKFVESQKEKTDDEKKKDEYKAPALDSKQLDKLNNAKPNDNKSANNTPVKPNPSPFVAQDTDKADASKIPDMSGQQMSQMEQEEMIRQIAKKQKPDDMIAFLKEIQSKFDFLKTQQRFKYDMKDYKVGDIFLWWEIEEITPVYIRFKEKNYSYNLRFLDGFER